MTDCRRRFFLVRAPKHERGKFSVMGRRNTQIHSSNLASSFLLPCKCRIQVLWWVGDRTMNEENTLTTVDCSSADLPASLQVGWPTGLLTVIKTTEVQRRIGAWKRCPRPFDALNAGVLMPLQLLVAEEEEETKGRRRLMPCWLQWISPRPKPEDASRISKARRYTRVTRTISDWSSILWALI